MRIHSVVVAYGPDPVALQALCEALRRNKSDVIVVDNTDEPQAIPFVAPADVVHVRLDRNAGVAEAFNIGIRRALEDGADVVVLFDQDSVISEGFIARLVRPLTAGEPGVAAAVARDKRTGGEYPARRIGPLGGSTNVFAAGAPDGAPLTVDVVISSGSAATAATFDVAGLLDEDFFIDFVDVEWCLRCRDRGVRIVVVPDAVMEHQIGERFVRLPLGLYRGIVHGPVRTYYKIRNAFLLARRRHVPRMFALHQLASALAHNFVQLALVKDRPLYARTLFVAVAHGCRGIVGKRPAA